jgi:hypothetical protein
MNGHLAQHDYDRLVRELDYWAIEQYEIGRRAAWQSAHDRGLV